MSSRRNDRLKYLIPPVALDGLRWLRAMLNYPRLRAVLHRNRPWRRRYCGERVYVIGNGPSAGDFDRNLFKGHKVIVMNAFHNAPWRDEVDIVAHCLGEPRTSPAWDPEDLRTCIEGTRARSYWFHHSSAGALPEVSEGKSLHFALAAIDGTFASRREIELHKPGLAYQTTAQLAVQVALYMGFGEIVLVGFDHDWLANPDFSRHFYSSTPDSTDKLGQLSYLEIVRLMDRMWTLYYDLARVATAKGVSIVNAAPRSYLDVFPRVDMSARTTP